MVVVVRVRVKTNVHHVVEHVVVVVGRVDDGAAVRVTGLGRGGADGHVVLAALASRLVETSIHVRAVLLGTTALDNLAHDAVKGTDAHAALAVAGEGVVAGEAVAALAGVGLDAGVDLGVALEVVLADEALVAGRALVLAVVEMGLDVRLDVLLAAKLLAAVVVQAHPLAVGRVRALDVLRDVLERDARVRLGLLDVDGGDAGRAGDASQRLGATVAVRTGRVAVAGGSLGRGTGERGRVAAKVLSLLVKGGVVDELRHLGCAGGHVVEARVLAVEAALHLEELAVEAVHAEEVG